MFKTNWSFKPLIGARTGLPSTDNRIAGCVVTNIAGGSVLTGTGFTFSCPDCRLATNRSSETVSGFPGKFDLSSVSILAASSSDKEGKRTATISILLIRTVRFSRSATVSPFNSSIPTAGFPPLGVRVKATRARNSRRFFHSSTCGW